MFYISVLSGRQGIPQLANLMTLNLLVTLLLWTQWFFLVVPETNFLHRLKTYHQREVFLWVFQLQYNPRSINQLDSCKSSNLIIVKELDTTWWQLLLIEWGVPVQQWPSFWPSRSHKVWCGNRNLKGYWRVSSLDGSAAANGDRTEL